MTRRKLRLGSISLTIFISIGLSLSNSPENKDYEDSFVHPDLGEHAQTFDTTHFRIHYTEKGKNAVSNKDNNNNAIPDYVETVAKTLEYVREISVHTFAWTAPPTDGTWGGNELYDVYLENLLDDGLAGYVEGGQEESIVGDNPNSSDLIEENAGISYMSLDRSFQDPESSTPALRELQATIAHEFMHSIQFGYDANEPAEWLWEASSNWMMEEVFDQHNAADEDLFHTYDSPDFAQSGFDTDWYGQWLFLRYISERYGHEIIRLIWEEARNKDGYNAIEAALEKVGSTLDDIMSGYAIALLTNNFEEGANYPSVRLEGKVYNDFSPPDGVGSMGADYIEIAKKGTFMLQLESEHLEGKLLGLNGNKASIFNLSENNLTVDSRAFDKLYLIVINPERLGLDEEAEFQNYYITLSPNEKANLASPVQIIDVPHFKQPKVAERSLFEDQE